MKTFTRYTIQLANQFQVDVPHYMTEEEEVRQFIQDCISEEFSSSFQEFEYRVVMKRACRVVGEE